MGSTGYTWHASDTNQVQHVNVHWHLVFNAVQNVERWAKLSRVQLCMLCVYCYMLCFSADKIQFMMSFTQMEYYFSCVTYGHIFNPTHTTNVLNSETASFQHSFIDSYTIKIKILGFVNV